MKKKRYIIYGLVDPRNDELRYIGWSSNGLERPLARHSGNCRRWEKSLERRSLKKRIVIFQEFPDLVDRSSEEINETMSLVESGWIAYFRANGYRLTNMTEGGEGAVGRKCSDLERRRRRDRMLGSKNPMFGKPSTMAGKPGTMKGRTGPLHPMYGFKHSEETRRICSEAAKKYWETKKIGG